MGTFRSDYVALGLLLRACDIRCCLGRICEDPVSPCFSGCGFRFTTECDGVMKDGISRTGSVDDMTRTVYSEMEIFKVEYEVVYL